MGGTNRDGKRGAESWTVFGPKRAQPDGQMRDGQNRVGKQVSNLGVTLGPKKTGPAKKIADASNETHVIFRGGQKGGGQKRGATLAAGRQNVNIPNEILTL